MASVDKEKSFQEIEVSTFDELRDLLENKIPEIEDFVFRGQTDKNWDLSSTLDRLIRHARETGAKTASMESFVHSHLESFKLEIRGRRGDNPSQLEENELWALGQHYGLATPLLDWSLSPYISAFFALSSITADDEGGRALWCLNRKKVNQINSGLSDTHRLELIVPDSDDNKRLLGQSGLFSKGPVLVSVNEWVDDKTGPSASLTLIKIVFPNHPEFRKAALKKLNLMNINHSTLFPDLEGASLHCNIVAEDYGV
ncbi:MAG: FRG domain-containing protein [Pseudomonadota bacterium]